MSDPEAPRPDRVNLDPEEVAGLIRGARLLELRQDTPAHIRKRSTEVALTAMDALCGLSERSGINAVWDALELVNRRELLAFSTLMASVLESTDFTLSDHVAGEPPIDAAET
ncbi:MAG: hypothetical protein JWO74_962 [Solirubrobacterales bacterium]|nr:hypothetical protein [Solirubrobacterales bacterium]